MTFDANNGMPQKWNNFARKLHTKTDNFQTILSVIRSFISGPFQAVLDEADFFLTWNSVSGAWASPDRSSGSEDGSTS
nr:hypothetical protein [Akkermansia sp. NBRC 115031]